MAGFDVFLESRQNRLVDPLGVENLLGVDTTSTAASVILGR